MLEKEFIPEKRLMELTMKVLKKIFFIFIAIITYYQLYEYVVEKVPINLEIINTTKLKGFYETKFSFNNGKSAIENSDFIKPIEIYLSNNIQKIIIDNKDQKAVPQFKIENNKILFRFDLLNKNENIVFKTLSKNEINITSLNFRIKDVDKINFYHYIKRPKPLDRLTNFWLIIFGISIIFFFDALLIFLKDAKLTEMKYLVRDYPLNEKNKYDFLEKYRQLYKNYKVRFKFTERFLIDFKIKNLLDMYDKYSIDDVQFIKYMINLNTEFSVFYRTRTIFILISPIFILISLIGITTNYIYYEIDLLKDLSLNNFNSILLKIILVAAIIMILFPRTTMNYFFIKRSARKSKNFMGF